MEANHHVRSHTRQLLQMMEGDDKCTGGERQLLCSSGDQQRPGIRES